MRDTLGLGNYRCNTGGLEFLDAISEVSQAIRGEVERYSPRPAARSSRQRNCVMAKSSNNAKKTEKSTYCLGLKAIAEYIGARFSSTITVRTVSRWIQDRGLPVKKKGKWTIANLHDLDEWIDR